MTCPTCADMRSRIGELGGKLTSAHGYNFDAPISPAEIITAFAARRYSLGYNAARRDLHDRNTRIADLESKLRSRHTEIKLLRQAVVAAALAEGGER